jgi:hypothetical protein
MPEAKLTSPLIRVVMAPKDGTEPKPIDVQTTNGDLVLWDRTRATHKWPKFDDAPFLWFTFISWAALRRTGQIPTDMKYEAFEKETLSVEPLDVDDEVDPTQPEAVPD